MKHHGEHTLNDDTLEILVSSILAVQRYSLQNTWNLLPNLRREGLLDPKNVASLHIDMLSRKLINAGYNRGRLTPMIANRLKGLMVMVIDGKFDRLERTILSANIKEANSILNNVVGIGPYVIQNIWTLLGVIKE